ncbi:MAG TPA: M20 family metallopeptidase [Devosia sp.]|nr:M20 family metallopeptidase [Devosia sp.]
MLDEGVSMLSSWIAQESPTDVPAAVNAMGDLVIAEASAAVTAERIASQGQYGDMVLLRTGPQNGRRPILMIGHLDTVHAIGTLAGPLPLRREGDKLYGPGGYDMKAGILIALKGLRDALASNTLRRPVVLALSPDEETGSPFSRAIIEALGREAAYALVFEPARRGGGCVTCRKGTGRFQMTIEGRAAHSGMNHEEGRSAIREAAHQTLRFEALTDYQRGITANVGLIAGGSGANTVPSRCTMTLDIRVPTSRDGDAAERTIRNATPVDPDVRLTVTGGMIRPPFERSDRTAALLDLAQETAAGLGLCLPEAPRAGGGSDGNFTAALGVPTLDALGAEGDGAHTHHEHVLISSLAVRRAFIGKLLGAL